MISSPNNRLGKGVVCARSAARRRAGVFVSPRDTGNSPAFSFLSVLILSLFCFLFAVASAFAHEGHEHSHDGNDENSLSNLCGVISTYVALQVWGGEKIDFKEVQSHFPHAKERGVNFNEISDYLKSKNYHTKVAILDKTDLQNLRDNSLAFILTLPTKDRGAHISLLRKRGDLVEFIDVPNGYKETKLADLSADTKLHALVVARTESELPPTPFPTKSVLLFLLFLTGIALCAFSLRHCFRRPQKN